MSAARRREAGSPVRRGGPPARRRGPPHRSPPRPLAASVPQPGAPRRVPLSLAIPPRPPCLVGPRLPRHRAPHRRRGLGSALSGRGSPAAMRSPNSLETSFREDISSETSSVRSPALGLFAVGLPECPGVALASSWRPPSPRCSPPALPF